MQETFSVIIPDRSDRPDFIEHCFFQLKKQTVKPDQIIHVNYKAGRDYDLIERVQYGISKSRNDRVFIIENDDYYPDDYFEKMQFNCDFIGVPFTWYYHLESLGYKNVSHKGRDHSSLFCTGFRISALKDFEFPKDNLLDVALWGFAKNYKLVKDIFPIGIKHGIGLCGSIGHSRCFPYDNYDPNMEWLKKRIRKESSEFYNDWHIRHK